MTTRDPFPHFRSDLCCGQMEGQNVVPSVVGPLAHNPSDLRFLVKVILASKPWLRDPNVMPLPWRVEEQQDVHNRAQESGLCFGVMRWDGMVMPHPPVQRAIRETVANLKAQGHEVRLPIFGSDCGIRIKLRLIEQIIDWAPPSHAEAFGILVSLSEQGLSGIQFIFTPIIPFLIPFH